eukprot:scaffold32165_cov147-Skeletonema_marinoi.AAC.7
MPIHSKGPQFIVAADLRRSSLGTLTLLPCLSLWDPLQSFSLVFNGRLDVSLALQAVHKA